MGRSGTRQVLGVVVGVALFAGACGGSDTGGDAAGTSPEPTETSTAGTGNDEPSTDTTGFVEFGPDALAVLEPSPLAQQLTAELGPQEAFAALLYALERGYDTETILAAAEVGGLQPDGTIVADGQVVEPTSPPEGAIVLPTGRLVIDDPALGPVGLRRAAPEPADPKALYEQLRAVVSDVPDAEVEAGAWVVTALIGLMRAGYSVAQITELLVLGDESLIVDRDIGCVFFSSSGADRSFVQLGRTDYRVTTPATEGTPDCEAGMLRPREATEASTANPTEPDSESADDDEQLVVDSATYEVAAAPQAETYGIEVDGGNLSVSAQDGELLVAGELVYEKWLWATDTEPLCSSRHTVGVQGSAMLEETMTVRLPAWSAVDLELLSWGTTANGEDYCESASAWLRDARNNEAWLLDEHSGAFMVVTVDDGSLTGCVVISGDICPDNLRRID